MVTLDRVERSTWVQTQLLGLNIIRIDGWRDGPDGKNQVTWAHFVEED